MSCSHELHIKKQLALQKVGKFGVLFPWQLKQLVYYSIFNTCYPRLHNHNGAVGTLGHTEGKFQTKCDKYNPGKKNGIEGGDGITEMEW
jgi:hypothetical protein